MEDVMVAVTIIHEPLPFLCEGRERQKNFVAPENKFACYGRRGGATCLPARLLAPLPAPVWEGGLGWAGDPVVGLQLTQTSSLPPRMHSASMPHDLVFLAAEGTEWLAVEGIEIFSGGRRAWERVEQAGKILEERKKASFAWIGSGLGKGRNPVGLLLPP